MPDLERAERLARRLKGATATLLGGRAAFTYRPSTHRMFLRAMRESFAHHYLHNPAYRELCESAPWHVRQLSDLSRLPTVVLPTGDRSLLELEGLPWDGRSIRRLRKLVRHVFGALGLSDRRRTHFLSREIPLPELLRKARWLAGERRLFWPLTHGVPYCACEEGSFHVPRYAHVDVQADGRLRLFSPWPHSFTGLSVLADERAERLRACACGLRAPAFRLL